MSYAAVQAVTARQRELAQASPRPSRVRFSILTRGVGETRMVDTRSLNFGAALLEEPTFSYGVVARQSLGVGQVPLATATVLTWVTRPVGTSGQLLYLGAELGFRVESSKSDIKLKFTLTFEGTALRSTYGLDGS